MAKKKNKGEEDEEEKKGWGGKLKIVVGVVAAAAIYKFLIAPSPEPESVDGEEAAVEEAAERVVEEGLILPLDEIVVNLTDADANRYLRVGIALVLEEGIAAEAVEPESPERSTHNISSPVVRHPSATRLQAVVQMSSPPHP